MNKFIGKAAESKSSKYFSAKLVADSLKSSEVMLLYSVTALKMSQMSMNAAIHCLSAADN
jgi:hypothetical protein